MYGGDREGCQGWSPGYCKRHAPKIKKKAGSCGSFEARWPEVTGGDWCGDWRGMEATIGTAK